MKIISVLLITLICVSNINSVKVEQSSPATTPTALIAKYKGLKNPFGHHSLFTGNNDVNASKYYLAVPPPIPDS